MDVENYLTMTYILIHTSDSIDEYTYMQACFYIK